jgi:hypothetical protein
LGTDWIRRGMVRVSYGLAQAGRYPLGFPGKAALPNVGR